MHVDDPVVAAKFPERQFVHAAAPWLFEYMPNMQLWHAFEVDPVVCKNVPELQSTHTVDSVLTAYCPAAQLLQSEAPAAE